MTHAKQRTSPNVTLAVLSLCGVCYALLSSVIVPALPTMQHQLHTSETGVTWLLTAYLLAASVFTPIIGRLGDMHGKERLLLYTLVILGGGTLLCGLASTLPLLIAGRFIQGSAGGIFPLAFGIVRDEFPREKIAGSIGFLSSILGVGGGVGIVASGIVVEHIDYHWLFWIPLALIVVGALATWRFVPESPLRTPGRINWPAAVLMTAGFSAILIAVSETTVWGWGSPKTIGLLLAGFGLCALWVLVELRSQVPLVDMRMMRMRAVWTTNAAAFLLGAGLYASFIVIPQFAQLPRSTGFGFGASVVVSGLYLLPATVAMTVFGLAAGRVAGRYGARAALLSGTVFTIAAFALLVVQHGHPIDLLASAALLGIGIGLSFAALGTLIVQAVPPSQTGVASGMNTVMRTLGGALGGQLSATFIANNVLHGLPTVTGFTQTFAMATGFLVACLGAGLRVPRSSRAERAAAGAGHEQPAIADAAAATETAVA